MFSIGTHPLRYRQRMYEMVYLISIWFAACSVELRGYKQMKINIRCVCLFYMPAAKDGDDIWQCFFSFLFSWIFGCVLYYNHVVATFFDISRVQYTFLSARINRKEKKTTKKWWCSISTRRASFTIVSCCSI